MFGKKGMDGAYFAIGALIGLIVAVIIISAIYNRGVTIPLPF